MSITHTWFGCGADPTTSLRVVARGDTNGTLTLKVNGATIGTATVNTSVNDGIVAIAVNGLLPGNAYSAELTLGAAVVTRLLRSPPNSDLRIVFGSCSSAGVRDHILSRMCDVYDPHIFVSLGDTPYNDNESTTYGLTSVSTDTSLANATNQVSAYAQHQRWHTKPDTVRILERAAYLYLTDDHEWLDNFCTDWVDQATRQTYITSQANLDSIVATQGAAVDAYSQGNPNISPRYFSASIGKLRLICVDCISNKVAAAANATFLGTTQRNWLTTEITAAKAAGQFVAIMSGKHTLAGNGDGWTDYDGASGDLTLVRAHIAATVVPVIWCTGDYHWPNVDYDAADGHLAVCASPLSQNLQTVPTGPRTPYWNAGERFVSGMLYLPAGANYLEASVHAIGHNGDVVTRWRGRKALGSNALSYPANSVGIRV